MGGHPRPTKGMKRGGANRDGLSIERRAQPSRETPQQRRVNPTNTSSCISGAPLGLPRRRRRRPCSAHNLHVGWHGCVVGQVRPTTEAAGGGGGEPWLGAQLFTAMCKEVCSANACKHFREEKRPGSAIYHWQSAGCRLRCVHHVSKETCWIG